MSTNKDREEFIAQLTRALPDRTVADITHSAKLLMRHSVSHGRIQEAECNGPGDYVNNIPYPEAGRIYDRHQAWCEKRTAQLERRISQIAQDLGLVADFCGDPRGYTVKLMLPNGVYNTWGGTESGYGVPQ